MSPWGAKVLFAASPCLRVPVSNGFPLAYFPQPGKKGPEQFTITIIDKEYSCRLLTS